MKMRRWMNMIIQGLDEQAAWMNMIIQGLDENAALDEHDHTGGWMNVRR
jgi:hypothetical protein